MKPADGTPDPSALARDGTSRFEIVTARLHELRVLQDGLIEDLKAYSSIVGEDEGTSTESIEGLGDAVAQMDAALIAASAWLGDEKAKGDLHAVRGSLHVIVRVSQSLGAISILTRTTAASYSITALNSYLDELSRVAVVIRERAVDVSGHSEDLVTRATAMRELMDWAEAEMRALGRTVGETVRAVRDIVGESGRTTARIQERARSLSQQVKAKFKGVVSAIQFSDRLAQRQDHLALILSRDDPHARHLAAAQARDMADRLQTTISDLQNLLDALVELGRGGLEIFVSSEIADEAERILTVWSQTISEIGGTIETARPVLDRARREISSGDKTIARAAEAFESLEASSKTVGNASMNSTLLAARSGDARGPLATLSVSVRECAALCLDAVGASKSLLNAMCARLSDGVGDVVQAGDRLESSFEAVRRSLVEGTDRLDQLNGIRSGARDRADRMLEVLADASSANRAMKTIADQLRALAEDADQPPTDGIPDPALLADIWDCYTMDEERAVHAGLYSGEHTPSVAKETVDSIDGLLF